MKTKILGLLALALLSGPASASQLSYEFTDLSRLPSQTPANTTASQVSGWEICGTSFGGYCGVFFGGPMGFSITANSGFSLNITGFSLAEWNTGNTGPAFFNVYGSVDNFANQTLILSGTLLPNASGYTTHSAILAFTGLSTFQTRIVAGGDTTPSGGSAWILDWIRLDVDVVPYAVPEPGTLALLGLGLAGLGLSRRRTAN